MKKSTHTSEYDLLRSELLRIRTDAQLSQRELAARLDVPHSWVAKVESGDRRIDLIEFCWLAIACDADVLDVVERVLSSIGKSRMA